jgi:hypothetical protein
MVFAAECDEVVEFHAIYFIHRILGREGGSPDVRTSKKVRSQSISIEVF